MKQGKAPGLWRAPAGRALTGFSVCFGHLWTVLSGVPECEMVMEHPSCRAFNSVYFLTFSVQNSALRLILVRNGPVWFVGW